MVKVWITFIINYNIKRNYKMQYDCGFKRKYYMNTALRGMEQTRCEVVSLDISGKSQHNRVMRETVDTP